MPKFQQMMVKANETFRGLQALMTSSKRSIYIPLVGITNLDEDIWQLDYKDLLFYSPIIHSHLHNENRQAPEYAYIQNIIFKYQDIDIFLVVMKMAERHRQIGDIFSECLIHILDKLTDLFNNEPCVTELEGSEVYEVSVRRICEIISMVAMRNILNVGDIYCCIKQYFESKMVSNNVMVVGLTMIYDSITMNRSKIAPDLLLDMAQFVHCICFNHLNNEEACLKKKSLFHAVTILWKQINNFMTEEFAYLEILIPKPVAFLLEIYSDNDIDISTDYLDSNIGFYLNLFATQIKVLNAYNNKLVNVYSSTESGYPLKLPHNITIMVHPDYFNVNKSFLKNVRDYPLTHDAVEKDSKYIISPPLFELLYFLALGELGSSYRFIHTICAFFSKSISLKAYNSINILIEMFTYKNYNIRNIKYPTLIFRLCIGLDNICSHHRQLSVARSTLIVSMLNRFPKLDQSINPCFFKVQNDGNIFLSYPHVNILYIWHILQCLYLMGYKQNTPPYILDYIKNSLNDHPHTWGTSILSKCPQDLTFLYENTLDFNQEEILNAVNNVKAGAISDGKSGQFKMTTTYFRMVMCVILDRLIGEPIDDRFLFAILKKITNHNLIHAIRIMIFYIISKNFEINSEEMAKIVEALCELIWDLDLITFDQLLLCLLTFHQHDRATVVVLHVISCIFDDRRLKTAFQSWLDLQDKVSNTLDQFEAIGQFYDFYPECFDLSKLQSKFSYLDDKIKPTEPAVVYFSNIVYRLAFYTDIIISRSLESPDPSLFTVKLLKQTKVMLKYHPNPIQSLISLMVYYSEILHREDSQLRVLVKKYLKYKYGTKISHIFSESFFSYLKSTAIKPLSDPHNHIMFLITRVASSFGLSFFEAKQTFGETLEEFYGNHTLQFLTCGAIELIILVDKCVLANMVVTIFLENGFIKDIGDRGTDPEYYIQTFGMLLAIMPNTYRIEFTCCLASYLSTINESMSDAVCPSFLKFDNTMKPIQYTPSIMILFLLRSYFYHMPIGYLLDLPK
ncbi:Mediator of RNA polymerase II transcription subunit 23 [Thelohanellus kitauei]|uniref:Mediator of RNA polymerase II transcription subunit 23 n=1 Tax=Thelohanellus kitauei TaxID=669202 RepID=A0A0C2JGI7_THEKT|nr:Mediator of RNA polymerase II transcription subunit 23 [Thelohanellus kitauei]